jgi:hypothetical protein
MITVPPTEQLQYWFSMLFGLLDNSGEDVVIRENDGQGNYIDHAPIRAKPNQIKMVDIMPGSLAQQGDIFLICNADSFPVARRLEQKDRVTFRDRDYAIINDDANQYSVGGKVLGRVLHIRG